MSSPVPPETGGAYIYDASTFLKGLRSISLRNLSFSRSGPAAAAVGSGIGSGRANGERDSASVTSASLRSLQAVLMMNDASASPGGASASKAADGVYGHHDPPAVAAATPTAGGGTRAVDGATRGAGGFCGRGKALLTTGVSQPTVNPTWPVSEASWLHADAQVEDLDGTRLLLLRIFAVDPDSASARDPSHPTQSPAPPPAQASGHSGVDAAARAGDGTATLGPVVWECTIDVKGLTALPVGSRLSHLWALPADCLLVEMSNGGLYAADWVVQALSSNSALPEAVAGGRARGGGGGGDAWRDDSDEEDDEDQEPLDEVLRRVLVLEAEAERGRVELAAQLEKAAPGDRKVCAAAESACAMDTLRLELTNQQELLEAEEASFLREKRYLQAETLAVEELLKGMAEAEEAAIEDGRQLESEKRETFKSHVLLEARRARLTAELQAIYPIKYQGNLKEFTIRGLELPADLYSIDDERISSALGYTAHLVCMLAKYLQISLRYQVIYNASRSAVRDNVTGVGVAYPLFRRGVEKERFDRGVYLLGRDVEQMLTARGVPAKRGSGQLLRNLERLMSIDGA
ncbi:unnamed protein product [Ectocarpus sp. 8 AP-2014]